MTNFEKFYPTDEHRKEFLGELKKEARKNFKAEGFDPQTIKTSDCSNPSDLQSLFNRVSQELTLPVPASELVFLALAEKSWSNWQEIEISFLTDQNIISERWHSLTVIRGDSPKQKTEVD